MKRADQEAVLDAVEEARLILGEYIAPGPRDAAKIIDRLLAVLDHDDVIAAVDHLRNRMTLRLVQ